MLVLELTCFLISTKGRRKTIFVVPPPVVVQQYHVSFLPSTSQCVSRSYAMSIAWARRPTLAPRYYFSSGDMCADESSEESNGCTERMGRIELLAGLLPRASCIWMFPTLPATVDCSRCEHAVGWVAP